MILLDSNVPMYLVGAAHPNKETAIARLDALVTAGERLVTDAEVLQEIMHRYVAIDRRDAIQSVFDAILGLVDEVLPIRREEAEVAKRIVLGTREVSSRVAIHMAVMETNELDRIMSFDAGFDRYPGIERLA